MLTFTLYYLCKNPEAMRKATEEVDEILGDEPIRLEHIGKLKYISGAHLRLCTPRASVPLLLRDSLTLCPTACLRESLRLTPPATIRMVESVEDTTVCGGKYAIPKGARIGIVASKCQTDPKVWGEDVCSILSSRGYNGSRLPDRPRPSAPSVCWATSSTSSRYAPIVTSTARMPDF